VQPVTLRMCEGESLGANSVMLSQCTRLADSKPCLKFITLALKDLSSSLTR